ncbi:MAG: FlgB family protein [Maritimibacter sp.]
MYEKLEIFRMAQGLATHAAARQSAIAQNIANADTPDYRARDLAPFAESYSAQGAGLKATRAAHLLSGESSAVSFATQATYRKDAASPNGNNVSLESEMLTSAEVKSHHDRALAVYKSALNLMRSSINAG